MREFIGIFLMLLGVIVGVYLGVFWGFIGGIIQVIQSISPEINAVGIAFGLARIFILSSLLGWLSFFILFGAGKSLVK